MAFSAFTKEDFESAPVEISEGGNYKVAPDGEYVMCVVNIEEKEASTGTKYVNVAFQIMDGEYESCREWKKYFKAQYLKEDVVRMGVDPMDFWDDREAILEKPLNVRKKTTHKNGYENVNLYINGPVDDTTSAADEVDLLGF